MIPFFYCYNNKFFDINQASFVINRAMKYGDGLFESIRVIDGKPQFYSLHIERLRKGMEFLKIEYHQQQFEEIKVCIEQLLIKNEINKGGRIRLTLFRSGGGTYIPQTNKPYYFIETEPISVNEYQLNTRGFSIDVAEENKIYFNPLLRFKTLNSLPYVMASMEKDKKLVDELVLLNTTGNIVEATKSNIFLVFGNTLYTPLLSEGCLDGVMRKIVIQIAKQIGLKVAEGQLPINYLERADELFLSNSVQGISWVGSYHKKRYFNKVSRKLIEVLNANQNL